MQPDGQSALDSSSLSDARSPNATPMPIATGAYLFFTAGSGSEAVARAPAGAGFVSGVSFDAGLVPGAGHVSLSGRF